MEFDSLHYPYPSQRNIVFAGKGMVCSTQPLASNAGLEMLKKGGNAVDAALAAASCLVVTEPTSNGIGGDAFALIWVEGKLYGLDASGPAPCGINAEILIKAGHGSVPMYGWSPVNVPGIPSAWAALSARFGKLPLNTVMEPAIRYAEEGYPVAPNTAKLWNKAFQTYDKLRGAEFKPWFDTFAPSGGAPFAGEIWKCPDMAKTLQLIAETKSESFYRGELAEKIDAFSRNSGGYLRKEDLERFQPEWVEPIKINYRGYDVWEIPPNSHGLTALLALNILKGFQQEQKEDEITYHRQIEAMKLAMTDGKEYITDRKKMKVKTADLLSEDYANTRRKLIGEKALQPLAGLPPKGGTVYLASADGEGNMVSYIQSNFMGFGSGIVIPGTGISLHNRGCSFSLDSSHVNYLEPGKKTYHTIIPGFLSKDGQAVGPFGVMGGYMQPQGHVQVIMNLLDFKLNPQAALDAPRWQWIGGKSVELEHSVPRHIAQALAARGHDVRYVVDSVGLGRGQFICKTEQGVLCGGTEPRADGSIAVW